MDKLMRRPDYYRAAVNIIGDQDINILRYNNNIVEYIITYTYSLKARRCAIM